MYTASVLQLTHKKAARAAAGTQSACFWLSLMTQAVFAALATAALFAQFSPCASAFTHVRASCTAPLAANRSFRTAAIATDATPGEEGAHDVTIIGAGVGGATARAKRLTVWRLNA